jgi:hypothetical protein
VFAEPTINDFLDLIDWHIAKARGRAVQSVNQVRGTAAASGALVSGRTVILICEAVRREFDSGVDAVLGELKRVIRTTKLDRADLRQHAVQRLMNFEIAAKAIARTPETSDSAMSKYLDEQFSALDSQLKFSVRQFDVGFFDPAEPEIPPVANNSITIGNMTGSTIQQGSPGAKQSVQFTLNIEPARSALTAFESSIKGANLPAIMLGELLADVHTIRAQLSKPSPTLSIVQEAGRSLRNVVEGVAAGILTPGVVAVAPALWSALGLG